VGLRARPGDHTDARPGFNRALAFRVTKNLLCALRHLRTQDSIRVLWVDAICVNQSDLGERGEQVQRMAELYRRARRVIAFIGESSDSSDRALDALQHFASQIEHNSITGEVMSPKHGADPSYADTRIPLHTPPSLNEALYELFGRPWFSRLWIRQEVMGPKEDRVVLLCGSKSIPWPDVRLAVFLLRHKPMSTTSGYGSWSMEWHARVLIAYHLIDTGLSLPFIHLLLNTRACQCSDPRDALYGILSLAFEPEIRAIKPDYKMSLLEVYTDFVLRHSYLRDGFDLLALAEHRKLLWAAPSWIPDLGFRPPAGWPGDTIVGKSFYAHAGLQSSLRYVGEGILVVDGVKAAKVSTVQELPTTHIVDDIINYMRKLVPIEGVDQPYVGGGTVYEAYIRTFVCDMFLDGILPPQPYNMSNRRKSKLEFDCMIRFPSVTRRTTHDKTMYLNTFSLFTHQRTFINTEEGHIGLAPLGLQPGDIVAVIFGCTVPLALRPSLNGGFKILGECYVCGLMAGEALLGPLPTSCRIIKDFRYGSRYGEPRFGINYTEIELDDDPRLEPLPEGWTTEKRIDNGLRTVYIHRSGAGEDSNMVTETYMDPRKTIEALITKGVDICEIELI
jgi:hypothetical protein